MCDHRVRHVEDAVIVETLEPRLLLSAALAAARAAAPAPLMEECPLAVLVPAVVEQESEGGGTNNVAADAQVLQFQSIFGDNGPGPLQAVIKGTADGMGGGGAVYNGSSMVFGAVAAPNVYDLGMTDTFAPGGDGVVTITAKADLDGADEYLTLAAEGVVLGDVFVNDGLNFAAVTAQVTIPAPLLAALAADGVVDLTVTPSAAVEREQTGYVMAELAYAGLGGGGTADCYAIDLQAGELLSLAADGAVSLELVDAEGTVLAEGDIAGFVAEQAGTYYARVAGEGEYCLVANRGAMMDVEDNGAPALAQEIIGPRKNGNQWVVGSLTGSSDRDVYKVSLPRNKHLQVRLSLPAVQANVTVSLYDGAGRLVATGRPLPHGRVMLQYKAPKWSGGEYFLQVTTDAAVRVDYVLAVSF